MSTAASVAVEDVQHRWAQEQEAYAPDQDRPLTSYAAGIGIYGALVAALGLIVRRTGTPLPERVAASDVLLISVATHKISRTLAKDTITSPLRAPFTTFKGVSGESELAEEVRGTGARHAVGELLTCPFCLGQWVATGLVSGLILAPRATRLVATLFTSLTGADVLQFAYDKLQSSAAS